MEDFASDAFREKGRLDAALAIDRVATRKNGLPTAGLIVSLAATGRRDEAERGYRQMATFADTTHGFVLYEIIGRAALAAGHHDEAIKWLERAARAHSDYQLIVRWHADMQPLMQDPAYRRLLDRMNIPY